MCRKFCVGCGATQQEPEGAAPGPSGMTVEHLHPLLDHSGDLRLFIAAGEVLARGQMLELIQTAVKLGRMTVLSKADGGVRGIVAGNVMIGVSTIDGSGAVGHISVPVHHGHKGRMRMHLPCVARVD